MSAAAPARRASPGDYLPAAVGIGALVVFFLAVELLIQIGVLNRFIIPPPSEVRGRGRSRSTMRFTYPGR